MQKAKVPHISVCIMKEAENKERWQAGGALAQDSWILQS